MKNLLNDRLSRYEETPSEDVWERIAASQNVQREGMWFVWIEGAAILAMAAILFLGTGQKEVVVVEKQVVVEKPVAVEKPVMIEKPVIIEKEPEQEREQVAVLRIEKAEQTPLASDQPIPTSPQVITDSVATSSLAPIVTVLKQDSATSIIDRTVIPPYKKPKSKFQFYLSLTPSLSFQKIIPSHDDIIVQGLANRSPLSMKRFGFGIDAGIQRDINHIFGYYGGLSFYRQQQELTYYYYNRQADVTRLGDAWTFLISRDQQTRTFEYTMTNIGASAGVLVTLKGEKLKHKFGTGLVYTQGMTKQTGSYNNSRSSYLAYQLFYRNEIKVNDNISWFAEPTFIYSFLSKEKLNEPFKIKPYRAGISVGMLYRF